MPALTQLSSIRSANVQFMRDEAQPHAMGLLELVRGLHRQVRERTLEVVIQLYDLERIVHRGIAWMNSVEESREKTQLLSRPVRAIHIGEQGALWKGCSFGKKGGASEALE